MKILLIGEQRNFDEFREKFGEHEYTFVEDSSLDPAYLTSQEVVFDFIIEENPDNLDLYKSRSSLPVFVNAVKLSLAEMAFYNDDIQCPLYGFNGFHTFVNRDILEVSRLNNEDDQLERTCKALNTDFRIVDDRVGMVTPRIVAMIINEAYYTLMEGTASRDDIDKGMKLGTAYPYGPFEWCEKIGLHDVYELLEALYDDTREERYKICPLMKKEYLKAR